jgi:hypothetical protein
MRSVVACGPNSCEPGGRSQLFIAVLRASDVFMRVGWHGQDLVDIFCVDRLACDPGSVRADVI